MGRQINIGLADVVASDMVEEVLISKPRSASEGWSSAEDLPMLARVKWSSEGGEIKDLVFDLTFGPDAILSCDFNSWGDQCKKVQAFVDELGLSYLVA